MPHLPRFANANHDDFAMPAQGFNDQLDRLRECAVELCPHGFERSEFDVEHSPGLGQVIHKPRMRGKAAGFNQDCAPPAPSGTVGP
jgi:hypothetical protein